MWTVVAKMRLHGSHIKTVLLEHNTADNIIISPIQTHHPHHIYDHSDQEKCHSATAITYSVLISYGFALHPYEKHELIKPEWVID